MGSDDESTREFDVGAMRDALAGRRPDAPSEEDAEGRFATVALPAPAAPIEDAMATIALPMRVPSVEEAKAMLARRAPAPPPTPPIEDAMATVALPVRVPSVEEAMATLAASRQKVAALAAATTSPAPDETGELDALPAFPLEDSGENVAVEDDAIEDVTPDVDPLDRPTARETVAFTPPLPRHPTLSEPTAFFVASEPEPKTDEVAALPAAEPSAPMLDDDALLEEDASSEEIEPAPISAVDFASVEDVSAVEDVSLHDVTGEAISESDVEIVAVARPALLTEDADDEERALLDAERWGDLVALYRQRIADADTTKQKVALYLKVSRVHEGAQDDARSAFDALAEAFELAPDSAELVTELDRVGKETGRLGELSDRLRKKVLPRVSDEKRSMFLGHLVYWYERVLGRGREVAPLLADLERHDKGHPVVLKRAAQIAAMNGDTKMQREHLGRALERTFRKEERVALHLLLAEAFAGTADATRHYETALEEDPTSLVALQAMKRLGREKENYEQVRWALQRQIEAAKTDPERIEALVELAELQETKFLKREMAAELLERVLALQPGHPGALKTLERCYHALRDWPKLARVLGLRAERTSDKKAKTELLLLAAEVHESKLGDLVAAAEANRNLLVVDPKHRRALSDLARLYEKMGDWSNHATYRARLAELAPTKRAMSQELVKLGDLLDVPERDPIAARLQYERAVVIDPTNNAGWEALQRAAAAAGDERRVLECLEQRREHTEVPRQKAAVLVELARFHAKRGNHEDAREAYEAAIRADASNEPAALVMLDIYTAEARWAQAAPLCELLVNAAVRDRDAEALFVRLRLATRIAAALGDADRAMLSAVAALDARPADPDAQADLVVVASQCRESAPAALARGRAHLRRIAETAQNLSAENLVRLGILLRGQRDLESAAAMLERAREQQGEDANITRELADVYLAQGDYPRACKLKVDVARNATNADARFQLLCEAGEIWARRAGELETAVSVFEEARAQRPLDPKLLQTLRWLYGELGDFPALAGVLDDVANAAKDKPSERIDALLAQAELAREKLEDPRRAVDLYEQVLDLDPRRLALFEEVVRILTAEKDWERLEGAFRKMLERVRARAGQGEGDPQLELVLLQQLGLIYRDRLGDAERAYEALDAATRLRPDDAEIRRIVVELLIVTDNLDAAVDRLREQVDRDPHQPQLYAELYELFLRQHSFDKAWCAVNVLCGLQEPSAEQRRFLEDYAPMALDTVPGQIVEQAWTSHVLHETLDPTLTELFALITPVVARMRWAQQRPELRVGRPFTPKHSRMHDVVRATFENAAEILALPTPDLLLGDGSARAPFSLALGPYGAVLVAAPEMEAQAPAVAYLVGKCLAEQRPELAARGFFPSVPELTSILTMAVRVSRSELAKDPVGAALDQSFIATLTADELAALRSLVLGIASGDSARLDVKAWLRAADLSSTRAGLLVAGDVEPARKTILAEVASLGGAAAENAGRDRIGELYKFAVGDLYAELRVAIGVAVEA